MLSVVVGMAFPGAPDAEAQGSHGGYTYTQRICQEYGQQPRWYGVREAMTGSDWRSDGGWAIVLERGSGISTTITFSQGSNPERSMEQFNNVPYTAGAPLVDNSGGVWHGHQGLNVHGSNLYDGRLLVLDADKNGILTAADAVYGAANDKLYLLFYARGPEVAYGGSYIRWANMAWCR